MMLTIVTAALLLLAAASAANDGPPAAADDPPLRGEPSDRRRLPHYPTWSPLYSLDGFQAIQEAFAQNARTRDMLDRACIGIPGGSDGKCKNIAGDLERIQVAIFELASRIVEDPEAVALASRTVLATWKDCGSGFVLQGKLSTNSEILACVSTEDEICTLKFEEQTTVQNPLFDCDERYLVCECVPKNKDDGPGEGGGGDDMSQIFMP